MCKVNCIVYFNTDDMQQSWCSSLFRQQRALLCNLAAWLRDPWYLELGYSLNTSFPTSACVSPTMTSPASSVATHGVVGFLNSIFYLTTRKRTKQDSINQDTEYLKKLMLLPSVVEHVLNTSLLILMGQITWLPT